MPKKKSRNEAPTLTLPRSTRGAKSGRAKSPLSQPALSRPPRTLRFDLAISTGTTANARFIPLLRSQIRRVHALIKSPLRELSIALVGDRQMSELHHEFLGLTGPTDVLTFALDINARGRVTTGEIAICVPEARRQARQRSGKIEHEVLLYAVHGMLHLHGFDDRTKKGFQLMHRREDQILTALGVGPVFRPAPTPRRSGAD
jgi:rRNA maturation RNase YbeY